MADPSAQYNFDSQTENDFEKISPAAEGFDQHHDVEGDGLNASGTGISEPQDGEVSTTTDNLQGEDEAEEDRFNAVGASEADAFATSIDPLIELDDEEESHHIHQQGQDSWQEQDLLSQERDIQPSAPVLEPDHVEPLIHDIASSPGPDPDILGFGIEATPEPESDSETEASPSSTTPTAPLITDFANTLPSEPEPVPEPEPEPIPSSRPNKPLQNDDFDLSPIQTQNESESSGKPVTESVQSSEPVVETSEGGCLLKGLDPRDSVPEVDNSIPQFLVELIYWRDVKRTGVVFGSMLVVLLSLATFSLVSVLAYLSLAALTVTFSFVLYKKVMAAVQKSNDGHPFKSLLQMDIELNEDKVKTVIQTLLNNHNKTVNELRRLFLVEDIVDSIKFGLLLWVFTYVGCLLNGMTLIILGVIFLFTLPKVYETYQVQIDNYIGLAKAQINNVLAIVQSKLPFLKKKDKAQ